MTYLTTDEFETVADKLVKALENYAKALEKVLSLETDVTPSALSTCSAAVTKNFSAFRRALPREQLEVFGRVNQRVLDQIDYVKPYVELAEHQRLKVTGVYRIFLNTFIIFAVDTILMLTKVWQNVSPQILDDVRLPQSLNSFQKQRRISFILSLALGLTTIAGIILGLVQAWWAVGFSVGIGIVVFLVGTFLIPQKALMRLKREGRLVGESSLELGKLREKMAALKSVSSTLQEWKMEWPREALEIVERLKRGEKPEQSLVTKTTEHLEALHERVWQAASGLDLPPRTRAVG